MDVFGKQQCKISYNNGFQWVDIPTEIQQYSSKYTFNVRSDLERETIVKEKINFFKGYHHIFDLSFHNLTKNMISKLLSLNNYELRFYPHIDSSVYYTVNCTLVKPFYIKNLYSTDGCRVVFETNYYHNLEMKYDYQNVSECWNMDAYSALGMMNNNYQRYGDMLNVTGLLGNCMRLNSGGANYIRVPNYEKATEWTFHTWINIPYDTDTGYFFSIGADGVTNQSLALWKRGAWTTSGGLVEVFIGGVSKGNITLQADNWHLLSVKAYNNNLYLYLDGYQIYYNAKGTTSVDYFYLGAGTGDRRFQLKIDQTVLFKTPAITNNSDTLYMYNNGIGRLVDMPKFYLS